MRWVRWPVKAVRFEFGLWRSMFLLLIGRRDGVRPGVTAVGYHKSSTGMWVVGLVGSGIEVPVLHLIVPWRPVQLTMLALGIWGVLFVAGLWASFVVRPYLVDATGIRLRHGPLRDLRLSWDQVTDVRQQTVRTWKRTGMGTATTIEDGKLAFIVHSETNVVITLTAPIDGVSEVHVGADDPAALAAALKGQFAPRL